MWHGVRLRAVLEDALANIKGGHWSVDEYGMSGTIDVCKDADTKAGWQNHITSVGPGQYW